MDTVTIPVPRFAITENTRNTLLALFIAVVVVFSVVSKFNVITVIVILILAGLILIIFNSSRGMNYDGSLPFATYPNPPHLGLDGVSVENRSMY